MKKEIVALSVLLLLGAGCSGQNVGQSVPAPVKDFESQSLVEAPKQKVTAQRPPTQAAMVSYRTNWFDIQYPHGFTANPGAAPSGKFTDTDEATFTSPDGAVEFFVFSTQFVGRPKNYATVLPTETLVSEKTEKNNNKEIHWVTVKANDGSYSRSFVSVTGEETTQDFDHVFGIKYRDQQSYEQYKDQYIAFKNSLVQYAD